MARSSVAARSPRLLPKARKADGMANPQRRKRASNPAWQSPQYCFRQYAYFAKCLAPVGPRMAWDLQLTSPLSTPDLSYRLAGVVNARSDEEGASVRIRSLAT